jgi:hypothetical protein
MTVNLKSILFVALGTLLLLLVPFIAMQFTAEVNWTASDFLIMGVILFSTGSAFTLAFRSGRNISYKAGAGLAIITLFLLIWSNLAVGFIGSGPNPANLMYGGMALLAITGAFMANFQPRGLSITMFALAIAQVLIPAIAYLIEISAAQPQEFEDLPAILGISAFFTLLWTVSGLLFRRAALK